MTNYWDDEDGGSPYDAPGGPSYVPPDAPPDPTVEAAPPPDSSPAPSATTSGANTGGGSGGGGDNSGGGGGGGDQNDPYPGHHFDPSIGQWVPNDPANPGPSQGPYPGYSSDPTNPGYPGYVPPGQRPPTGGPGDPTYDANPRDFMINRDKASWEAYLKQQLGPLYDPTTLQSAVANISYAQNAGLDPKKILDGIIAKEKLRLTDTPGSTYVPSATPWGGGSLTKPAVLPPRTTPTSTMSNYGTQGSGFNFAPAPVGNPYGMSAFGTSYAGAGPTGGSGGPSGGTGVGPSGDASNPWGLPADLMAPWTGTFKAPDPTKILDDPLVQSRIALGMDAIQKGAAGRGTLLTPGVQKSIADFAGTTGSDQYWNLYNAAQQEFQNSYNMFEGDQSRRASNYMGGGNLSLGFGNLGLGYGNLGLGYGNLGLNTTLGLGNMAENQRMDTFGMNRANTMDAFNIYNTLDTNYYDRLFKGAGLGMPQ